MNTRFLSSPPRSLLLCASLSLLTLCHSPARAQEAAAAAPPRAALITALRGGEVSLDVGARQGAVRGAVYSIAREGRVRARVQILSVSDEGSMGRILDADEGFVLAVGDTLQFQSIQAVAEPATPVEPPTLVTPPTPVAPVAPTPPVDPGTSAPPTAPTVNPPGLPSPNLPPATVPATDPATDPGPLPISANATVLANVVSVEGSKVTFDAGEARGVRPGSKVAIARNGDVVAIARITIVESNRSVGEVIFSDPSAEGPQIGDSAPLLASSNSLPSTGSITTLPPATPIQQPGDVPSTPVRFETGASNEVVPRADESYDYLAALAASKLLPRQYPAHLFHDEGSRLHRTEEDLTLSRAQIAGLTLGALRAAQAREDGPSRRDEAALRALGDEYRDELQVLGATPEELRSVGVRFKTKKSSGSDSISIQPGSTEPSSTEAGSTASADVATEGSGGATGTTATEGTGGSGRRFVLGISGRQQASFVTGSGRNSANVPFSERQGGLRARSGFDTRTNLFGHVGEDLRFFAQINGGNRSRADQSSGLELNEAFIEYNASKHVRGLKIQAGRDEIWWGPGHFGTLLLSDVPGPLNLIQTTFKRGSYQLQGLYAPLDRGPGGGRRSLYGHNLSVQLGKQTRIGLAETLLLPRSRLDAVAFVGAYSPIPLFTLERLRKRNTSADNGNILVEGYLETSLARGVRGWAEFLVDDLGVNGNNQVRNRLGTLLGAHFFTPKDPAKLGFFAEYANLQGRTYLALRSPNDSDYFYRGDPLGYPVAPDPNGGGGLGNGGAESLRFEAYWRPLPRLRLGGGLEFADINSEDNFRSRQQVYRLRAAYDLSSSFTLVARAQRVATDTALVANASRRNNLLQLEIVRSY